jgi:sodium transport system permease protein
LPHPADFAGFARVHVATQLAFFLAPALLMALVLTSRPRQTLLLKLPRWQTLLAAATLAITLQPAAIALRSGVQRLYPITDEVKGAMQGVEALFANAPAVWVLLILALVPAVCEELAFRGFILSGFRHSGRRWRAIVASAVVFGLVHGVLQQSILACLLGILLGYLAVQSGSILPGMIFHFLYNGLILASTWMTAATFDRWPALGLLVRQGKGGEVACPWQVLLLGGLLSAALLAWFSRLPYVKSPEEQLHDAIRTPPAMPLAGLVEPERP